MARGYAADSGQPRKAILMAGAAVPVRLLLADVDGTLVTKDKVLTPAAIAAAQELQRAGIKLAITSGRPPRGMKMLVTPLSLQTPLAGFNGGVLTQPDLTVIQTRTLAPEAARTALAVILDSKLDAWIYTADEWLVRDTGAPHVSREAWTVKFEAAIVPDFTDAHLAQAVKIVGVSDDPARVEACEALVKEKLGTSASAARSQPYYLDVTHPDANKGGVVDVLSGLLGIPHDSIATIGDMPNDVLMFERSGYSIAMGNASDQVKARASDVTESNENDGFASAVRTLILPRAAAHP